MTKLSLEEDCGNLAAVEGHYSHGHVPTNLCACQLAIQEFLEFFYQIGNDKCVPYENRKDLL